MATERVQDYLDSLFGEVTPEAAWRADVTRAHANALSWVRATTGTYPSPRPVADRLAEAAEKLKHEAPAGRDPEALLIEVAARARGQFAAA